MSKNNNEKPPLDYPRAQPMNEYDDNVLMQRPAPPSYDESLQQVHPNPYQQQHQQHPQHQQHQQQFYTQAPPMYMQAPAGYGYPQGYGAPPMYPQTYMAAPNVAQAYAMPSQHPPVLTLAQGAEMRTTSGAVNIPPPPPGYAPTPAQWAAMQGQQVMVKEQKKRSFFS